MQSHHYVLLNIHKLMGMVKRYKEPCWSIYVAVRSELT